MAVSFGHCQSAKYVEACKCLATTLGKGLHTGWYPRGATCIQAFAMSCHFDHCCHFVDARRLKVCIHTLALELQYNNSLACNQDCCAENTRFTVYYRSLAKYNRLHSGHVVKHSAVATYLVLWVVSSAATTLAARQPPDTAPAAIMRYRPMFCSFTGSGAVIRKVTSHSHGQIHGLTRSIRITDYESDSSRTQALVDRHRPDLVFCLEL